MGDPAPVALLERSCGCKVALLTSGDFAVQICLLHEDDELQRKRLAAAIRARIVEHLAAPCESEPASLPMIELDDAIAAAGPAVYAWWAFAEEMEWAAKALRRGDVLRWKTGTFAAVRHLNVALGSR